MARIRWRDASSTYFFYDGALRRYAMIPAGASQATYFLWEGMDLLQERSAAGTVTAEHTNARTPIAGIAQLVETYRPGEGASLQKIYPVMDWRGSITKWLQSDGATVLASREYDAFGNIVPGSATGAWPGRFGYQGQAWFEIASGDSAQRLLLSPTRLYEPGLGILLQNDPHLRLSIITQKTLPGSIAFRVRGGNSPAKHPVGITALTTLDIQHSKYSYSKSSLLAVVDPSGAISLPSPPLSGKTIGRGLRCMLTAYGLSVFSKECDLEERQLWHVLLCTYLREGYSKLESEIVAQVGDPALARGVFALDTPSPLEAYVQEHQGEDCVWKSVFDAAKNGADEETRGRAADLLSECWKDPSKK